MKNETIVFKTVKLLLVLEFFLQIISFSRYIYFENQYRDRIKQAEKNQWWHQVEKYESWSVNNIKKIYPYYYPFITYKIKPINTAGVHVNADGVRATVGNPKDNDYLKKKIFFFGGSVGWGQFAVDKETIPSLVAQKINQSQPKFEITNYCQTGYLNNQELIYLLLLLKNNKIPDYVIFLDGFNDSFLSLMALPSPRSNNLALELNQFPIKDKLGNIFRLAVLKGGEIPVENRSLFDPEVLKKIINHIKIYDYSRKIFNMIIKKTPTDNSGELDYYGYHFIDNQDINKVASKIAENYIQNADIVDKLAKQYGFKYFMLWQPLLFTKKNLTEEEKRLLEGTNDRFRLSAAEQRDFYLLILEKIKAKKLANFYDFSIIFDENKELIFLDEAHIVTLGNEIIADEIKTIIQNSTAKDY